jgi:hypothetical protein
MTPRTRKLALALHVTASVAWLGAVLAFVALASASVASRDLQLVRGACLAMALVATKVIVPLALGALLTGLGSALGTPWGLFRHYWVLLKLLLTLISTVVLLVQLAPIRALAALAADPSSSLADLGVAQRSLVHSVGGLCVLLVIQGLSAYKPSGLTRYGWRKRYEHGASTTALPP